MTVALYVVVARLYPAMLHPRVFAWFAAAWIIPSLVGPAGAGAVAQHAGWRWVFLGVALLVIPTTLVLVPALRRIGPPETAGERGTARPARLGRARRRGRPRAQPRRAGPAAVVGGRGRRHRGRAPSSRCAPWSRPARCVRRAACRASSRPAAWSRAAFLGAEVYLPYLLTERYAFSPTTAGIALTFAGVAWAGTSWLQGRLGDRLPSPHGRRRRLARWSSSSVAGVLVTAAAHLPPAVAISSWTLAGAGMGLVYSRLTVLVLAYSAPGTQGVNSSALSIADSIGAALALALTGARVRRRRPQPRTRRSPPRWRSPPCSPSAPRSSGPAWRRSRVRRTDRPTTPRRARCAAERASAPRSHGGPRRRGRPARGPSA